MKKQNHQIKSVQVSSKSQQIEPIHNEKNSYQMPELADISDHSIQVRAYQIHQEKGGTAVDNWQEAEHALRTNR